MTPKAFACFYWSETWSTTNEASTMGEKGTKAPDHARAEVAMHCLPESRHAGTVYLVWGFQNAVAFTSQQASAPNIIQTKHGWCT